MSAAPLVSNLPVLSISESKEWIKSVVIDQNQPGFLHGPAGVGKSQSVAQVVEEIGGQMIDLRLSQYESVDLRGIPEVERIHRLTEWCAPATMPFANNPRFPDDQILVMFFDELPHADQSVQAVAHQMVLERRVGEHLLRPNVRVLAAGNRQTDKGVHNRIASTLANRFTHTEVTATVDDWCAWGLKHGMPASGMAFLQWQQHLLLTFNPDAPELAFATPRSWATAFKYDLSDMRDRIKRAAMEGVVGTGNARQYQAFKSIWGSLTPIADILKNPNGTPIPTEMSEKYAMTLHVSGSIDLRNASTLYTYLERFAPEFTVLGMSLAARRIPDKGLYLHPVWEQYAQRHQDLYLGVS